ncbi:MAG: hypothetical protein AAF939_10675 [Planctomycetota bacterium]
MKITGSNRNGFVLIATLIAIATVTVLTAGLARHSLSLAMSANFHQESLQQKWGSASCERFALTHAIKLLRQPSSENPGEFVPVKSASNVIKLGNMIFEIRLDDESAKMNTNFVLTHGGPTVLKSMIRKRVTPETQSPIRLRPLDSQNRRLITESGLESWKQVFLLTPQANMNQEIKKLAQDLTHWGTKLNLVTAPNELAIQMLQSAIGPIKAKRLMRKHERDPSQSIDELLDGLSLREDQQSLLQNTLAKRSQCQSVWISCFNRRGGQMDKQVIQEQVTSSIRRIYAQAW